MATQLNDGAARYDVDDAADFDAADLEVGDRIDPVLVSSTLDGVDAEIYTGPGVAQSDAPRTQLACLTATNGMDDVHVAILSDGESGVMVRASRHDPQSAWTQKEADWKVRGVGTEIDTSNVEVVSDPDGAWDEYATDMAAQDWAEIVVRDTANGGERSDDEVELRGRRTLRMRNPWECVTVEVDIELTDE